MGVGEANMVKAEKNPFARSPTLDTVLMVEKAIVDAKDYPTPRELWKSLPKKVMWQTFFVILDYLESNGKIVITPDGKVMWTWNPHLMRMVAKRKRY